MRERAGSGYLQISAKGRTSTGTAQVIKYGVVGMDDLLRDLWTWDSLIVAGRLHKPVHHIVRDPAVMKAAAANLNAAMAASLLNTFSRDLKVWKHAGLAGMPLWTVIQR